MCQALNRYAIAAALSATANIIPGGEIVGSREAPALASDPVGAGVVTSLARPGGNATGLSTLQTAIVSKRLELLREVVPGLQRLAIWANAGNPGNVVELDEVAATARTLGLEVAFSEIRRPEDI